MKKKLLATAFAAAVFSVSSAYAEESKDEMEKCKAVNSEGKSIVKEHKGDCATKGNSCSGQNKSGDDEAWIMVPKGQCDKINQGDFSGVSKEVMDKLEVQK